MLWTLSELYKNVDKSRKKKLTNYHEKTEVDKLFINLQHLTALSYEDLLQYKKSDIILYIFSYTARQLFQNNRLKCNSYCSTVTHGLNMIDDNKIFLEYSSSHMNLRDNRGLY